MKVVTATNRTLLSAALVLLTVVPGLAVSEIKVDGTVGSKGAGFQLTEANGYATSPIDYLVKDDLGTRSGTNLFHSFDVFNVETNGSATFSGPAGIANIINRITGLQSGPNISNIDGALKSDIAGANVYLFNPSGVIFGENASLDISGSFHTSTASYLLLADGVRFDASSPESPVLSSAPPVAFGFLGAPVGSIEVNGSLLEVDEGMTLSLIGGDVSIKDGLIYAPGGQINVVSGELDMTDPDLGTDQFDTLGKISVEHTGDVFSRFVPVKSGGFKLLANLDTTSSSGGTVMIRSGKFYAENGVVFSDSNGIAGPAGSIDMDVRDEILLTNESLLASDATNFAGDGGGGSIVIRTTDLRVESGSSIQLGNFGSGSGGTMQIEASGTVSVSGKSPVEAPLEGNKNSSLLAVTFGSGEGGDISVVADDVVVGSGGEVILDAASGSGNGGSLTLEASRLKMSDGGVIVTRTDADGNAGNLTFTVQTADLSSGAEISSATRGAGTSGDITMTASDSVTLAGSDANGATGIFSNSFSTGDGGQVKITAGQLALSEGAAIQAAVATAPGLPGATAGTQAGSVDIQVDQLTINDTSQISTQSENAGQAGSVSVDVSGQLAITSEAGAVQAGIFSTALGSGSGGSVEVAAGSISMDGGAINASSATSGDAGTVSVITGSLAMNNGAQMSTSVSGTGNGGLLNVEVDGNATLSGENSDGFSSGLYSLTEGSGTGGDIQLAATNVLLNNNATINAESTGSGDAGGITVTADNSVTLDNASITTEAADADGGNIKINAPELVYLQDSEISAAVGGGDGDGGNVSIDPKFVVMNNSRILASAIGGDGGNITIVADHFIFSSDSILNASSELGIDGTINIISSDENIDDNLVDLPTAYLDAAGLLKERCSQRHQGDRSSFVVSGRTALPATPESAVSHLSSFSDSAGPVKPVAYSGPQGSLMASYLAASAFGCTL